MAESDAHMPTRAQAKRAIGRIAPLRRDGYSSERRGACLWIWRGESYAAGRYVAIASILAEDDPCMYVRRVLGEAARESCVTMRGER